MSIFSLFSCWKRSLYKFGHCYFLCSEVPGFHAVADTWYFYIFILFCWRFCCFWGLDDVDIPSIPVPEFIDPVFGKTSPIRSFSVRQNERFGLVFAKTGSINSGTSVSIIVGVLLFIVGQWRTNPWPAVQDWPWCRNADAGLTQLTTGKNADAGLAFFRHPGVPHSHTNCVLFCIHSSILQSTRSLSTSLAIERIEW